MEENSKIEDVDFEIEKIVTKGDKESAKGRTQFDKINFVQDIEKALLGDIDIAVHSAKDMPAKLDPILKLNTLSEDEI